MLRTHGKMAMKSLRSNKVRTFLTLLGIIIGVTSVTTIIGLGEGVKRQVNQQISELGSDLVTVVPGRNSQQTSLGDLTSLLGSTPAASSAILSEADFDSVKRHPNVNSASAAMRLDGSITYEAKKYSTQILGVNDTYLDVTNQKLTSGQFFGGSLENNQTVILASNISEQLFGSQDPLGNSVTIRGTDFIVIGVLDTDRGFNFGRPINDTVLIPLPTAAALAQNTVQLQQISFKLTDPDQSDNTIDSIKSELTKHHGGEEDFTITTQQQLATTTSSVFRILTGFTAAVASISLLVGGIGVMNIMLVTVTERTKEIGIRKAVGATRTQIMMQFLIESLAITLAGGFIGIFASLIVSYIIRTQTAIQPAMDPWIILLAAGVSLGVGIIFGTWPAIRAARKAPIEALRYD